MRKKSSWFICRFHLPLTLKIYCFRFSTKWKMSNFFLVRKKNLTKIAHIDVKKNIFTMTIINCKFYVKVYFYLHVLIMLMTGFSLIFIRKYFTHVQAEILWIIKQNIDQLVQLIQLYSTCNRKFEMPLEKRVHWKIVLLRAMNMVIFYHYP